MRLCCIDIDGVIANRDARLALARSVYLMKCDRDGKEPEPQVYNRGFDWDTFQDPSNVYLDTLILGVNDALNILIDQGYILVFLSSRSEHMYADTLEWFALYVFIRQSCPIVLKDAENRYTKTATWKAQQVVRFVEMYQPSEVLCIDDREDNLQAIVQVLTVPFQLHTSLAAALEASQDKAMRWLAGER